MEQFVTCYRPPASYKGLKRNLTNCGESERYLKTIKHIEHHNHYYIPTPQKLQLKPIKHLSSQGPMNVDPKNDTSICYSYGKKGHIAHNCKIKKNIQVVKEDPYLGMIMELKEMLAKEKSQARVKGKAKYKEQSLCKAEEDLKKKDE